MASPEALAAFQQLQVGDPTNKKCFECGCANPVWCDMHHAVYLCLECSGKHRGLGTHISFVRSVNMDGWPDANLAKMRAGGNAKARAFLKRKGALDLPFHEKWNHDASFMYKDMISAIAKGERFDEASWTPPAKQLRSAAPLNGRPDPASINGRMSGIGSQPQQPQNDQWSSLASGWNSFATAATNAAAQAGEAASVAAQQAKEKVQDPTLQKNATEGWNALANSTKSGWGNLTSWAKSTLAQEEEASLADALRSANLESTGRFDGMGAAPAPGDEPQVARAVSPVGSANSTPVSPADPSPARSGYSDPASCNSGKNKSPSGSPTSPVPSGSPTSPAGTEPAAPAAAPSAKKGGASLASMKKRGAKKD